MAQLKMVLCSDANNGTSNELIMKIEDYTDNKCQDTETENTGNLEFHFQMRLCIILQFSRL